MISYNSIHEILAVDRALHSANLPLTFLCLRRLPFSILLITLASNIDNQHLLRQIYCQQLCIDSASMENPPTIDRGTRFTNFTSFSSIHSKEAFVDDYEVTFTPQARPIISPQRPKMAIQEPEPRQRTKSSRFTPRKESHRGPVSQSFMLPADMPNTSYLMPAHHGVLPEVHVRYTIPPDEKQIVESLRTVQRDLNRAQRDIENLTRERDDARNELRLLHLAQNKSRKQSTSQKKDRIASQVEQDLFDLSKVDLSRLQESPERPPARQSMNRRVTYAEGSGLARDFAIPQGRASTIEDESVEGYESVFGTVRRNGNKSRVAHRKPEVEEAEQSMVLGENTAASNTSRRRRQHVLDENMTSEYILPDITVDQQRVQKQQISAEAQHVLQQHEQGHVRTCEICQRLTQQESQRQVQSRTKSTMQFTTQQPPAQQRTTQKSEGAQVSELLHLIGSDEPTMRPKISPAQALENVRIQTKNQFEHAKERFTEAWQRYDAIEAPKKSGKHETAAAEMKFWQVRMEESRVSLDNLRDVQEGIMA